MARPRPSFGSWLSKNGTAKAPKIQPRPQSSNTATTADIQQGGMGISSMDFHTRVQRGKTVEERIKDVLRANGFQVTDPTSAEDMYQKIDCFLDGQAAQIKYRDSGDDILYELIKPHDLGMSLQQNMKLNPGRDFRGKAA